LAELASHVGASESTVRRDLDFLDDIGALRRTHGGAAARPGGRTPAYDLGAGLPDFDDRRQQRTEEKSRIAQAVADLIRDGESVLLDGGTTTFEVAKRLVGRPLKVFTNSIPVAALLSGSRDVELALLGGFVYPKTGVALGPMATQALAGLHVQRLVLGVAGITARGLFNGNMLLVETERAMLACAEETIVVADRSKFGVPGLTYLCGWEHVHRVVTDAGISADQRALVPPHVELRVAAGQEAPR
jgi:DeoR/GlpR family transcriptional regulator of sugar metabolism